MKHYELTYLISPELPEREIKTFQEKINSLIQAEGGIIGKEEGPTRKRLASSIEKNIQAYLVALNFQLNSENLTNLEKKLKEENQVLRYMILAKPPAKIGKKVVTKPLTIFKKKAVGGKVELKEIEKKLEEILGE